MYVLHVVRRSPYPFDFKEGFEISSSFEISLSDIDDLYATLFIERYPISIKEIEELDFYRLQYIVDRMVYHKKRKTDPEDNDI